ncbi:AraC family transcriptional regulator [Furfurilactobacillus curtus]|uniref:HTH-type transcriptional activator RhaS n=1 Tax=Furfurilactobacillus curtus TaxID=1746200 RepID=A0ABQ5JMN2_9LACO
MQLAVRDPQIKVLWMSGRLYHRHEVVEEHQHMFAQAQIVLNGQEYIEINHHQLTVFANQLVLIQPHTPHSFHFEHDTVIIDIKFELSEDVQQLITTASNQEIFPVLAIESFRHLLNEGVPTELGTHAYSALQLDVDFKQLLLKTIFATTPHMTDLPNDFSAATDPNATFPLQLYLQQHYDEPLTLESLAKHFNYSKNYLIRICKQHTGLTPANLLQRIRIKHAQNYLEYTDLSVNTIGIKVGLDPNYLTKLFTRLVGQAPLTYRKTSRAEHEQNITLVQSFNQQNEPAVRQTGRYSMD